MSEVSQRPNVRSGQPFEPIDLYGVDDPEAFDALTRLALRLFNVPTAIISLVREQEDRQFFLSQQGVAEPWASARQTPLSKSFCQHVKRRAAPLIVHDAREDPLVKDNEAIEDLDVIAYLGVPIFAPDQIPIRALCVIESQPRAWSDDDISTLKDLAHCVNDEIALRSSIATNERARRRVARYSAMRESISLAFMAPGMTVEERFESLLRASCDAFGACCSRIVKFDGGPSNTLFEHHWRGSDGFVCDDYFLRQVASECCNVHFADLAKIRPVIASRDLKTRSGSYAGSPLILDGILYGVVEFYCAAPRAKGWTEEELSLLCIISMFITAQLGIFGQIAALQNSEAALLKYVADHSDAEEKNRPELSSIS